MYFNTHTYIYNKWKLKSSMGTKTDILSRDQTGVIAHPKTIMDKGCLNLELPPHIISNIVTFAHTHTKYTCVFFPQEMFFAKCFLYF